MESSKSLTNRMIRAAKLDVQLYEEVEADSSANSQALMVVIIASLAVGIGGAFAGASVDGVGGFLWGLIIGLGLSIVGWLAWAFLAFWLGTTIFRGPQTSATFGELLRTIGFSNTPIVLTFFAFIPFLGFLIVFTASIWALIAGIIAVRQALDFSTMRAIATCAVGWLIYVLLALLVATLI